MHLCGFFFWLHTELCYWLSTRLLAQPLSAVLLSVSAAAAIQLFMWARTKHKYLGHWRSVSAARLLLAQRLCCASPAGAASPLRVSCCASPAGAASPLRVSAARLSAARAATPCCPPCCWCSHCLLRPRLPLRPASPCCWPRPASLFCCWPRVSLFCCRLSDFLKLCSCFQGS